jgi:hypothetical protein
MSRNSFEDTQNASELTAALRNLVESEVDVECWEGGTAYLRQCPGEHLHTTPSDGSPVVWMDRKVPVANCLHHGCQPVLAELNRRLYELFVDYCEEENIHIELTPKEKAERAFRKHLRVLRTNARLRLAPKIMGAGVPIEKWTQESPFKLDDWPVKSHWRLYLAGLFAPNDLLWGGELYQSGPEFKRCFRTVKDWLKINISPGPQICLATFDTSSPLTDKIDSRVLVPDDAGDYDLRGIASVCRPCKQIIGFFKDAGKYRRSKDYVKSLPYVVLESDTLSKVQFGDLVRYFQKYATLRALTDTGNKSVHVVFDRPELSPSKLRELYAIAEGLGADPKMFRACVTTRLPGCKRLDEDFNVLDWQKLLYLNPKYPIYL